MNLTPGICRDRAQWSMRYIYLWGGITTIMKGGYGWKGRTSKLCIKRMGWIMKGFTREKGKSPFEIET